MVTVKSSLTSTNDFLVDCITISRYLCLAPDSNGNTTKASPVNIMFVVDYWDISRLLRGTL